MTHGPAGWNGAGSWSSGLSKIEAFMNCGCLEAAQKERRDPKVISDVAILLTRSTGKGDWAHGNYQALGDQWQRDLGTINWSAMSALEAILPGTPEDAHVRSTGVRLWVRG